ncbi:MAG TPA: energy transducer TonB [Gemmatimonadaceae bacterium]|nr:energy transducer TonB [Gemmatimonadaceae bacterium]
MSSLSPLGRASTLVCSLTIALGASRPAGGQTLGGQVVQLESKKPIGGAAVALVNDSATVVASTSAGLDGAFYLDAPAAGVYRLVLLVSGGSFVSPGLRLDAGKTVERLFSVPDVPSTFAAALFARDVTKPASPIPGSRGPVYPPGLAEEGIRATISTMFVVNEVGQPDLATLRVLNTSPNERFVESIREALGRTRFVPARKDDEWVPQVVQYTYDFGLRGDPDRGDVMIRPPLAVAAETRRVAREPRADAKSPVKTMYVVTTEELSKPGIETMSLSDALHRLRPRLFGPSRNYTRTSPSEGPVFVNDIRVEGIASLRNITAGDVEEVRYLKHEEAVMKFGMEIPYAITVKMRPDRS